ncbi:DUF218 domain-containing protein [Podospora didyma]|uniref:DUF218 domain-containing protein n=1 Tax=Podospora didyma TaxID=330526 RepID=A0AAE0U4A3_9PEZI|nr:DUF218 domain-containing protein [Podospora didyma]
MTAPTAVSEDSASPRVFDMDPSPTSAPAPAPAPSPSPAAASEDAATDADAELIYNYHRLSLSTPPLTAEALSAHSAIFTLCSLDTRVAVRAAELFLSHPTATITTGSLSSPPPPLLIFSGGVGALTTHFTSSEASLFASIAARLGVPESRIITEPDSTNTGENVRFTYALLTSLVRNGKLKDMPDSFVLVQKPYMERRTYATFVKQWPDENTKFCVTSPELAWSEYPDADSPRDLVINIMVGDLVRIRDYPARGFQIAQEIPAEVWAAAERLMAAGYTAHLP